jgi:hypothetical protein
MKDLLHMLVPMPRKAQLAGMGCAWRSTEVEEVLAEGYGEEEYYLSVTASGIRLEASTDHGMFLGHQTIAQLHLLTGAICPGLEIHDSPDNGVRGYMLDISRCKVPRMSHLFHLVDLLALFKYNQLQLYMEHTFAYDGHEVVWADASPMTPGQIKELQTYCSDRYIELVPNQNAFGHMERWLKHEPYRGLAESPDGFEHPVAGWKPVGSVLFPGDESIGFIDGLMEQLLPCFKSGWIHLGCDEPWELGQGRSSNAVEQKGRHTVYKNYLLRLRELVASHGRKMLFWSDELRGSPDRIRGFPEDMIPVAWGYERDHDFAPECAAFSHSERSFLVAPGDSSWNSFTGRLVNASRNIEHAARTAREFGAEGMLLTSWGDQGHQQVWPTQLPGLVAFAAASWNLDAYRDLPLENALDSLVFRDASQELGRFWVALGRIDSHIPVCLKPENSSFPYDAIYASRASLRHVTRHLKQDAFFPVLSILEDCRKILAKAVPGCDDGGWVLAESRLALEMTRQGIKRAEGILKDGKYPFPDDQWKATLDAYKAVWLRRNRDGGLDESLDWLGLEQPKYKA